MAYRFRRCCDSPANPSIPHIRGCAHYVAPAPVTAVETPTKVSTDAEAKMLDEVLHALKYHYDVLRLNPVSAQVTDFDGNIIVIRTSNAGKA